MGILTITAIVMVIIIFGVNSDGIAKMIGKTSWTKFDINTEKRYVMIGASFYKFSDMESVSVVEDEQPSLMESLFSRYTSNNYYAEIWFNMKNGTRASIKTISKVQIYRILKKLQPYVSLQDSPEYYKFSIFDLSAGQVLGIILSVIYLLYHYLMGSF